ncbi:MAG: glycosyltransferase [Pseudomonadota bacterium]
MKISVIISTYNSPQWLPNVLTGYSCQDYEDFEIVVADDGSTPLTAEVIERFIENTNLILKHVRLADNETQKCAILNKAIDVSEGDYLIFTDGDCVPHHRFVSDHAACSEFGRYICGGYCKMPEATSKAVTHDVIRSGQIFQPKWLWNNGFGLQQKWPKVLALHTGLAVTLDRIAFTRKIFSSSNSSCFRGDALRVNGFDERIGSGCDGQEFGYRLENAGIFPIGKEYSILCMLLDHKERNVDQELEVSNQEIMNETRSRKLTYTNHGIVHG